MKNNIKTIRQKKGIVLSELAARLGLSQPSVTRMENGVQPVTLDRLRNIANALGCEAYELLPAELLPKYREIDDQERFFKILHGVNAALGAEGRTAPEEEKIRFVMFLYNQGYGLGDDAVANEDAVSAATKIGLWHAA